MGTTLKAEYLEFLASLQAIVAESNSDEDFLRSLSQRHIDRAGGLRGHIKKQCAGLVEHIDRLELERKMIARLVE